MPKYGQRSTFDRKGVETQFFNQNDRNWILKRFPSAQGHFALKFFLYGLIRQLVILTRIRLNFTMLTSVWYLRGISYPRVLQWALRITKKVTFSTPAIQKTLFGFLGWRLCQIWSKVNFLYNIVLLKAKTIDQHPESLHSTSCGTGEHLRAT